VTPCSDLDIFVCRNRTWSSLVDTSLHTVIPRGRLCTSVGLLHKQHFPPLNDLLWLGRLAAMQKSPIAAAAFHHTAIGASTPGSISVCIISWCAACAQCMRPQLRQRQCQETSSREADDGISCCMDGGRSQLLEPRLWLWNDATRRMAVRSYDQRRRLVGIIATNESVNKTQAANERRIWLNAAWRSA